MAKKAARKLDIRRPKPEERREFIAAARAFVTRVKLLLNEPGAEPKPLPWRLSGEEARPGEEHAQRLVFECVARLFRASYCHPHREIEEWHERHGYDRQPRTGWGWQEVQGAALIAWGIHDIVAEAYGPAGQFLFVGGGLKAAYTKPPPVFIDRIPSSIPPAVIHPLALERIEAGLTFFLDDNPEPPGGSSRVEVVDAARRDLDALWGDICETAKDATLTYGEVASRVNEMKPGRRRKITESYVSTTIRRMQEAGDPRALEVPKRKPGRPPKGGK